MATRFDPAKIDAPAVPEWYNKYHEEWLEWAKPMMGVTPCMTAKSDRVTASEVFHQQNKWHGNLPVHIDYEALRREL